MLSKLNLNKQNHNIRIIITEETGGSTITTDKIVLITIKTMIGMSRDKINQIVLILIKIMTEMSSDKISPNAYNTQNSKVL
jgi:hypothetical protein